MSRPSTLLKSFTLTVAATLTLAACTSSSTESESQNTKLSVVTTTTQLADFASHVGGDDVTVKSLLTSGSSSHTFEASPADLMKLGEADVLIINGAGLDTFVEREITASGFNGTIIDASAGVDLDLAREITAEAADGASHEHEAEHGDEPTEEQAEDHADEADASGSSEATDEKHNHDESLNPHLWTSPLFAADMVQEIADGLAKADSAHATNYEANAAAYIAQLEQLDAWLTAQFERVPAADRVLVTGHDSLRYFLHDYNIAFAGSLLPNFDDNTGESAASKDELIAAIKASGVKAIFVESTISPKLAESVARDAGVKVYDEHSIYADALGAPGSGADTYISATISNAKLMLEAWGVTPDPVPADLER